MAPSRLFCHREDEDSSSILVLLKTEREEEIKKAVEGESEETERLAARSF